jgi:anhydro-N-acetylmuramic acid kinase
VRHQPAAGYTIQLVNSALLAELTDIDVVCDFRSRDIAAGGQGAPLAPGFHQAAFASPQIHRVIVNIGGIANLTDLPLNGNVTGFDCGTGNLLLDSWAQRHLGKPFDAAGAWAQRGKVLPTLLAQLQAHPFFQLSPPKSAGRDTFSVEWLDAQVKPSDDPADVQATLLALTASGIVDAIEKFCAGTREIYVCGGGAYNLALMNLLTVRIQQCKVTTTETLGIPVDQVEALAFAWLARQTLRDQPGNLASVTGARGARVLGAIYRK